MLSGQGVWRPLEFAEYQNSFWDLKCLPYQLLKIGGILIPVVFIQMVK